MKDRELQIATFRKLADLQIKAFLLSLNFELSKTSPYVYCFVFPSSELHK